MKNIDHLSLDGRSLYMLKQIYELRSVTETARLLGVTQSSVSHSLDRLRRLLGDPLFLKVGRTMVPTERVEAMMEDIDQVLQSIEALYAQTAFDPLLSQSRFSILCNDFEHDLLVPEIFTRLKSDAPHCTLRTYQRQMLDETALSNGLVDMELCPYPPEDATDLVISKICTDHQVTYYDATIREAPNSLDDFLAAEHATLCLGPDEETHIDRKLRQKKLDRRVSYLGPNFSAAASLVRGTSMLTTAPSRMCDTIFRDFAWVETPVETDPIDFYMVWHVRNRHSPRHKWFRELVKSVARALSVTDQKENL